MIDLSVICSLYNGYEYLNAFLENLRAQTIFSKLELVLIHNEPRPEELKIINSFIENYPSQIQHITVNSLESIGASWNRGLKFSNSPFVSIWNVDDRRIEDSLERQLAASSSSNAVLCYGDYIGVNRYGAENGIIRHTPIYAANSFSRSFHQGGAFWVLRRSIVDRIGGFDEQFRIGSDMEFSFRIAVNKLPMVRAPGCLGYFTNEAKGLSTLESDRSSVVERTAIQLRYAVYDKINPEYYQLAKKFRTDEFMIDGRWLSLEGVWPGCNLYRTKRQWLWFLGKARYLFRKILARLRFLDILHKLHDRFTSKEI